MVIVGSVSYLSGGAVALGADGTERVLFVGDQIYAGDVVRVAQDAEIEISMDIGESIRLDSGQSWLVSNETYMSAKDLDLSESSALAESIRASTLAGQDPTDIYEAPAAGGSLIPEIYRTIRVHPSLLSPELQKKLTRLQGMKPLVIPRLKRLCLRRSWYR